MKERSPDYPTDLYRGITVPGSELSIEHFTGELIPGSHIIQKNGTESVRDGNEYGVYMSTNRSMVESSYSEPRFGRGLPDLERITHGLQRLPLQEPSAGILYHIDPGGLDIRKPLITDPLQGVYNNGFLGDEWITDVVPTENFSVQRIKLPRDSLHDELVVVPDGVDIAGDAERISQEAQKRIERLKMFGAALRELTPAQRMNSTKVDRIITEVKNL